MKSGPISPIPRSSQSLSGSKPVAASVRANGATAAPEVSRLKPVEPMRVIRQHIVLLSATVVASLLIGIVAWLALRQLSPGFTSKSLIQVTGGIRDPYENAQTGAGVGSTKLDELEALMRNQAVRMERDEVLRAVLERPDVRQTAWFQSLLDDGQAETLDNFEARKKLSRQLAANPIKGSTLIEVSFTTGNRDDPQIILSAVLEVFLDQLDAESKRGSHSMRRTFTSERRQAEENIRQIDEQIKQFAIEHDLPNLRAQDHEASLTYRRHAELKAQVELSLQSATERYNGLLEAQQRGTYTPSPDEMVEVEADPAVATREERLRSLREQRRVYLERFGDSHRSVREIDLLALSVEQEKNEEIDRLLRERQAVQIEQAKKAVDGLQAQLATISEQLDLDRAKMRDVSLVLEEYESMQERRQAETERRDRAVEMLAGATIRDKRDDSAEVQLVSQATEAEMSFPKPLVIIPVSVFMITGLVTGIVFLQEVLDQRVKSPADLAHVASTKILGVLPDADDVPSGPSQIEEIVQADPTGLIAEAFRQVRTSILSHMDRRGYKTLMVVSPQAQGGASVVTQNLAMSLAIMGRRVLVLDANLRQPAVHRLFHIGIDPGLTDVLTGAARFDAAVVSTDQPGLSVLPIGRIDKAAPELLESGPFREMLSQLTRHYDLILIDAPPALLTSESCLLAKQVDAVAVVVRAISDMRGMITRVLRQLDGQRADVLGIVLNGVRSSAGGYFRKNYAAFDRYRQRNGAASPMTSKQAEEVYS